MNRTRRKQLYSLCNYIHAGVGAGLPFQMVIVPLAVTASWMQFFASAHLSKSCHVLPLPSCQPFSWQVAQEPGCLNS